MKRRRSGLIVVNGINGGKLEKKPTRKQIQLAAATSMAQRILGLEARLANNELLVEAMLRSVIAFGLPVAVVEEEALKLGIEIKINVIPPEEEEDERLRVPEERESPDSAHPQSGEDREHPDSPA